MAARQARPTGFADPVLESQASFRELLEAMARPGRIGELRTRIVPPRGLSPAQATLILTLADFAAPVLLAPGTDALGEAAAFVRFHAGAPVTDDPAEALFVLASSFDALGRLSSYRQGTDEAPEGSATLIVEVAGLGAGCKLRLTGPGIERHADLAVEGLGADTVDQLADNRARFPRGIDMILTCGTRIAGLPRTTRVEAV